MSDQDEFRMKPLILALAQAATLAFSGPLLAQSNAGSAELADNAVAAAAPASFDQQFLAARTLATSGQREQALLAYSALLARSPGNTDVLLGRGRVYAWMGRWAEAETDLLAATSAAPNYADAWSALGDLYMWSDRPAQAVDAYGKWLALAGNDDPAPLVARGRAYRAVGNLAAARADFQAAGARGADPVQIQNYQVSLTPRVQNPDAAVPAGYLWSASLGASWTEFNPVRPAWTDYTVSVRRHFEKGSLAFEWLEARRFRIDDHAWALDGYLDLWNRAYANVRYQQGPQANLFPENSWRVELFQGVGRGWELSASYDRLQFSQSSVNLYGLGVGRYVGNWYLRGRRVFIPGDGSTSTSDRLLVRYYYLGDGDNYVEVTAGAGRSNQAFSNTPGAPSGSHSSSGSISFVKFLNPRWGFKFGASYGEEANGFTGHGVFGSLYTRW